MDTKKIEDLAPLQLFNTYTDSAGAYDIDSILTWVNNNKDKWTQLETREFLPYIHFDTWSKLSEEPTPNFKRFIGDNNKKKMVPQSDLNYPIILTNDNRVIDGIHRLSKAIYEGYETIKSIFIDRSVLDTFKTNVNKRFPQTSLHLPIPDRYLKVPKSFLPFDKSERRNILESYFLEHLPSALEEKEGWLIRLERPQEQYGCYALDSSMATGLKWWKPGTQISDIPFQKKLFEHGLLAIEDQWIPYSWSRFFQMQGEIPAEIILLHLDDHQDMMSPRIGKRLDGKLFDYITGDSFSLNNPLSVEAAILSGAIGKGSILTPLIWSVEKIHVRHLCFRPHSHPYYHIHKIMRHDGLLSKSDNRISAHLEPTQQETLQASSNYFVTPDTQEWLTDLPIDVPILLHIDMDYFNDRFDGNSSWKEENKRVHEISLEAQLQQIEQVFANLKERGIAERIVDTSIGISPGFYPAEFWSTTVPKVIKECNKIGIKL